MVAACWRAICSTRERRALALARGLRRRAGTAVGRPARAGARLHRRRGAASGQAAWRCRLFPDREAALRKLHRAGICHNDLAKEQNWLRGTDGSAYLTDFQLAACFKRRSKLFRVAAYEDLRHLLKHKRRYAPAALTPKERKVLARKSVFARVWLMTGKKVYVAITRGLFNFTDREGGGKRLVNDAPVLIERIKESRRPRRRHRRLRRPPRRRRPLCLCRGRRRSSRSATALRRSQRPKAPKPPEHIQIVPALPRDAAGTVAHGNPATGRDEPGRPDRAVMTQRRRARVREEHSANQRKNLRDRFNFEAAIWRRRHARSRHPRRRVIQRGRSDDPRASRRTGYSLRLRPSVHAALPKLPRRDARHSVHSICKPRRGIAARTDRCPRRDIRSQLATDQRQRQERRPRLRRHVARSSASAVVRCCPRLADQLIAAQRAASASACRQRFPRMPLPCCCSNCQRQEQLPPRGVAAAAPRSPAPCPAPGRRDARGARSPRTRRRAHARAERRTTPTRYR